VNAFHVCGALLAIWAIVLFALGVSREDFPATAGATRIVSLISVVLTVLAIGSAIYTGATEEEEHEPAEEGAAIGLPT
jgi:formate-dependent nitrite reductase membrane component NrfD